MLEDEAEQAADRFEVDHDRARLKEWLDDALRALSDRERYIVAERRLREDPRTLESLGTELACPRNACASWKPRPMPRCASPCRPASRNWRISWPEHGLSSPAGAPRFGVSLEDPPCLPESAFCW